MMRKAKEPIILHKTTSNHYSSGPNYIDPTLSFITGKLKESEFRRKHNKKIKNRKKNKASKLSRTK